MFFEFVICNLGFAIFKRGRLPRLALSKISARKMLVLVDSAK